jgi:hypothetical protein
MTDRPIMFSKPMILALLEGRKTMTRRLLYRSITVDDRPMLTPSLWARVEPGDKLWVRENFYRYGRWIGTKKSGKVSYSFQCVGSAPSNLKYAADDLDAFMPIINNAGKFSVPNPAWHLRPNIFLPRELSRLTLIVTGTKIERLNDISEADAAAEGAPWYVYGHGVISDDEYQAEPGYQPNKRMGFCQIWNDLHGWGPPSAWDANPDVIALTFRVVRANVDEVSPPARTHVGALARST